MRPVASRKTLIVLLLFPLMVLLPWVPRETEAVSEAATVVGWGGTRLKENMVFNWTNPASIVFPGEQASNQEVQARAIVEKGLRALRVSFAPYCTDPNGFMSPYNSTRLERSFRIAETLGMWIIVDYHGYRDLTNSTVAACWLEFWSSVVLQFKDRYQQTIWEPLNEPSGLSGNITLLSYWYQQWINQARALGDVHWVVVQNLCSYGCALRDWADGYPTVTDPLGKVFISIHPAMSYRFYYLSWNNTTAELLAERYYQTMINGTLRTGWPVLNTEGGPGRLTRTVNGTQVTCPDLVLKGSAGYCRTNFHFIERLTSLLDSNQPQRINRVWWPVGDWTDSPGAEVLGALAPNGWGRLLGRTAAVTDAPVIVGWGGTRLKENAVFNKTNPPSIVFPGEQASNQEVQARAIVNKGLNVLRVSFAPYCTDPNGFMSPYNSTRLERSFRIMETLGMWIIVDYHGYRDLTNGTVATCWLEFWSSIVLQFKDRYNRTIWEPLNEPSGLSGNMTMLSYWYQRWVNQTRELGDNHWIVVQNLCSYGCALGDWADSYPSVKDPLGKVFISIHPYMSYRFYYSSWDNTTAEILAERYYQTMLNGALRSGWPILNTEGGPGRVTRTVNGTTVTCPDLVFRGSAGYCGTNFHFVQTLTSLLDSNQPQRVKWVWWPIGDWTDTPGAEVLGALADNGWGSLLTTQATSAFNLAITVDAGGTTFPGPGNYIYVAGTVVNVSVMPLTGYMLDHWEVDQVNQGAANPMQIYMNSSHLLRAVFTNATTEQQASVPIVMSEQSSSLKWQNYWPLIFLATVSAEAVFLGMLAKGNSVQSPVKNLRLPVRISRSRQNR